MTATVDPTVAIPPAGDESPPGASQPTDGIGSPLIVAFIGLAVLLAAFLAFAVWYLVTRQPISELPGVTSDTIPHYSFTFGSPISPTGIALSADGERIYVAQTEEDPKVLVFDRRGSQVGELVVPAQLGGDHVPVYVAVNPVGGDVYVTDRPAGALYVFGADGAFKRVFDPGSDRSGWQPLGLAFAPDGTLLVTDVGNGQVHEFAPDGSFLRTIGAPGEFSFPNGVAFDSAGRIYVADSNHGRVLVFDAGGRQLATIPRGAAQSDLGLPRGMVVDREGLLYVVDTSAHAVQVYRELGKDRTPAYVGRFGEQGTGDGAFEYPNAVAVDARGRVYVTDWRNDRIQVWSF